MFFLRLVNFRAGEELGDLEFCPGCGMSILHSVWFLDCGLSCGSLVSGLGFIALSFATTASARSSEDCRIELMVFKRKEIKQTLQTYPSLQ